MCHLTVRVSAVDNFPAFLDVIYQEKEREIWDPSSHIWLSELSPGPEAPAAINTLPLLPGRSVSVTTWRSSSPAAVRRRRTGGGPGRNWPETATDSCGAVRRWSRASLTACSRSTAAWCTSASPPSASRTPERSLSCGSRMPEEDGASVLKVQGDQVIKLVSWKAELV